MDMIFKLKFTKGHNSVKTVDGVMVFVFSNCLMMLYICISFMNISQRASKVLRFKFDTEIYKGA